MDDKIVCAHNKQVLNEMKMAAVSGQLERVKELYNSLLAAEETDEDWEDYVPVAAAAAGGGHLQIVQWLWEQNQISLWKFFVDNSAFISAASLGHLHILQWLQQQPSLEMAVTFVCDDGINAFNQAAGNGHLHIIQWLREQDPPCDCSILAYEWAAGRGHLHIIQWLREQDPPCPWDPPPYEVNNIFSAAAESGQLHIMRWLYVNGFPWKQQYGTEYMRAAAAEGDLKALEWPRVSILHSSWMKPAVK